MNYPENNQTGVDIDKALVYTFAEAINPDSIFSGSVALYDSIFNRIVEGSYSYDEETFTLTFLPNTVLNPNTTYVWYFAGADTEGVLPLELANNDPFPTSFSIGFQTGSKTSSTTVQPYVEDVEDGAVYDGQNSTSRASDVFYVTDTTPKLLDSFVDVSSPVIQIKMSSDIKPGQDFDTLIKLTYQPLLRITDYYKERGFNPIAAKRIPGEPFPVENIDLVNKYAMPTGTWTLGVDNRTLTWESEGIWNANAFVVVTISKDLLNTDDAKLNGNKDESFHFLTDIYPMFSTIDSVLLPLVFLPGFVAEDVVVKFILKHSLEAWHLCSKKFSLAYPPRAAVKYAEIATAISLIDSKSIVNELNRGKLIALGDLKIEHGFPRNPEAGVLSLRADLGDKLLEAKTELLILAGNYSFRVGVKGANTVSPYDVYRNQIRSPGDQGYIE